MPHNDQISQRRFLSLDQFSSDSGVCRPPIPETLKKWTACRRNEWSTWPGMGGRHGSEWVVDMARNMQYSMGFDCPGQFG